MNINTERSTVSYYKANATLGYWNFKATFVNLHLKIGLINPQPEQRFLVRDPAFGEDWLQSTSLGSSTGLLCH